MGVGEYLIIFAAILIGLSVADLALSLHRLMRQGRAIRWDPIVPVTAFIVLCLILNIWWGLYRGFSELEQIQFIEFLPVVLTLLTLFLLAAAVLPDEKLEQGSSLREYYLANRVQFWGLFAFYLAIVTASGFYDGWREGWEAMQYFQRGIANIVWMFLCIGLIFTKRMAAHWGVVIVSLVAIALSWFNAPLAMPAAA